MRRGCWYRYKDLAARDSEVGEIALALYCATVRATLFVCKGYECQEKEGVFMTAFPGPIKALEWAVTLQMALLRSAHPVPSPPPTLAVIKQPSSVAVAFAVFDSPQAT